MHFTLKVILQAKASHHQYAVEYILCDAGDRIGLFTVCHRQAVNLLNKLIGDPEDERIAQQNQHEKPCMESPHIIRINDDRSRICRKHHKRLV